MDKYLQDSYLLDYNDATIIKIITKNNWHLLTPKEAIQEVYQFVQNEITFGYNKDDYLPASKILKDGFGQCNTKSILLMAFLRRLKIPCRMHGFIVTKEFQKGALKGLYYKFSPTEIIHGWVEVLYNDTWFALEGVILDKTYIAGIKKKHPKIKGEFHQYAISTSSFQNLTIDWDENDTFIQKESIIQDLGIFDTPDNFLIKHQQKLSWIKKLLYQYGVRHLMNRNIKKIKL